MNKSELIKKIAEKTQLSQADSKKALDATVEAIKEALAADESVAIVGFGTLSTTVRPARKGKNPRTGAFIEIPAKKVAKFKAGSGLIY